MHVRAFDYLRIIAETGSLRSAAQKLGITATALTRQIEHLEYFFRVPLLERDQRGIRLTAAGEVVVETAERVSDELDATRRRVDDLKGLRGGIVKIHASSSTISSIIGPALASLHADYPGLRFAVEIAASPQIGEALVAGRTDLGVTIFSPDLTELTLCARTPVLHSAIVSPSHPLCERDVVYLDDIQAHTLALPDSAYFVRRAFERVIQGTGVSFDPVFITGSFELQLELALQGRAVLLLPDFSCRAYIERGQLRAIPLASSIQVPCSLDLLKASHKPLSHAGRVVSQKISEIIANVEDDTVRFAAPIGA